MLVYSPLHAFLFGLPARESHAPKTCLMKEGVSGRHNCRPAELLLGGVRRASNTARCADRCRGHVSCRGHHRTCRRSLYRKQSCALLAHSGLLQAAVGPGSSSMGSLSANTGARTRGTTLEPGPVTLSILTAFMQPATKYGIWSPTWRPINAAPNGDRTDIWARSDVQSSGQTNWTVFRGPPQFVQ